VQKQQLCEMQPRQCKPLLVKALNRYKGRLAQLAHLAVAATRCIVSLTADTSLSRVRAYQPCARTL